MKLSEAMRQGWQGIGQCTGEFQIFDWDGHPSSIEAACAIGAACRALTDVPINSFEDAIRLFPELEAVIELEDVEYGKHIYLMYGNAVTPTTLKHAILYYNDDAQLDKERVIELVESMGY
jgi:hypothetical protein